MPSASKEQLVAEISSEVAKNSDALLPYLIIAISYLKDGIPPQGTPLEAYIAGVYAYISSPEGQIAVQRTTTSGGSLDYPASVIRDVKLKVRDKPSILSMKTLQRKNFILDAIVASFSLSTPNAPLMRRGLAQIGGYSISDIEKLETVQSVNDNLDKRTAEVRERTAEVRERTAEVRERTAEVRERLLKADIILGVISGPCDDALKKLIGGNIELFRENTAILNLLKDIVSGKIQQLEANHIELLQKYTN